MSLSSFLHHLSTVFHSDKVKRAFEEVDRIVIIALPIIKEIDALVPNRKVSEIVSAFERYGVPFEQSAMTDPGAALLHLATVVVADQVPASTARNIIQTAIQIAVTGHKAETAATS